MKTRTNQTIAMLVVMSMTALTTSQINTLSAGDIVLKKDESGYHSYIVSYKKEGTGICLTYTDASCVETVSYDLVEGEWVYNSTDITQLGGTKLYEHTLVLDDEDDYTHYCKVINNIAQPATRQNPENCAGNVISCDNQTFLDLQIIEDTQNGFVAIVYLDTDTDMISRVPIEAISEDTVRPL